MMLKPVVESLRLLVILPDVLGTRSGLLLHYPWLNIGPFPRRRWEDDIRKDLEEIGINAGNWVDSTQDRNYWRALVKAALNLQVP